MKRAKILSNYGDMRKQMGLDIKSMWFNLGQHKHKFIPSMVGSFLEMTLVPDIDLRNESNNARSRDLRILITSIQGFSEIETRFDINMNSEFHFYQS